MIRFIKGKYHPGLNGRVIIETASGFGFEIHIASNSPVYKNLEGEEVRLYTSMRVKEDDISLYGFTYKEDLELFELLVTVNGVGAKAAMSIMGTFSPDELKVAIASGNAKELTRAGGIGKKTSERIVLELKDKVGSFETAESAGGNVYEPAGDERAEAVAALMVLGYTKTEAASAVNKVKADGLSCEEYIKNALKNLF